MGAICESLRRLPLRREHLLTAVLADETRFAIYRSVAESPNDPVTVADVAERFGLHPNVARMHLGKLEQAGLVATSLRKSTGGGRPAKLYRISHEATTFAFPPRHYELLASLALEALAADSDGEVIARVCRTAGEQAAGDYRRDRGIRGTLRGNSLAAAVQDVAEEQGLLPEVEWIGSGLRIEVRNCVFREAAARNPELSCVIHRAFFRGLVDGLAGDDRPAVLIAEEPSMGCGGDRCRFTYSAHA
jgi:predicted ArsR family transcriptional regulator